MDAVVSLRLFFIGPSHTTLWSDDGWMNSGFMNENPANSLWSMLAMTSWSGGVSIGCVRVKNLSKFSAALPLCESKARRKMWVIIRFKAGSVCERKFIDVGLPSRATCTLVCPVKGGFYKKCLEGEYIGLC